MNNGPCHKRTHAIIGRTSRTNIWTACKKVRGQHRRKQKAKLFQSVAVDGQTPFGPDLPDDQVNNPSSTVVRQTTPPQPCPGDRGAQAEFEDRVRVATA